MNARRLEPELLDHLPAADPPAVRSRQDLRRLNTLMGHVRHLARAVIPLLGTKQPLRVVELGGGDGTVLLGLATRLRAAGVREAVAVIVDQQELLSGETADTFARLGWKVNVRPGDVISWLREDAGPAADLMLANLFLHHFDDRTLAQLLANAALRTSLFAACEPRRSTLCLLAARLVGVIGCNAVTRHDAVVSVRAGFSACELSRHWPAAGWRLEERAVGLFSHLFVARPAADANPLAHARGSNGVRSVSGFAGRKS